MALLMSWTRVYLMIVLPIAYCKVNHEWNAPATITYKECKETVCKEEAQDIIACMNRHVNPCEDFFEYVCGNWPQRHVDPNKQYKSFPLNIESVIEYKAYTDIRSILEQPIHPREDKYNKRAKALYKDCMNLPWMGKMDAVNLKPIVANAGPWPMFPLENDSDESYLDWVSIHNYYLRLTGESALFGLTIRLNPIDKTPVLEIRKLVSPYGTFTRYASWTLEERNDYITFLNTIAHDVKPPNAIDISMNNFDNYIEDVFDFRHRIQQIINSLDKQSQTSMTIEYLNAWYNENSAIRKKTAEIPWLRVIQALYENDKSVQINGKTIILLSYSSYFLGLRSLFNKMSSRTIINHIHLYFIERHLRLTRAQKDLYYVSRSLLPSEPVAKSRGMPEKWYACIEKHALPDTLGKMYIENHSSLMAIEHVKRMIREIKDMVIIQINDATWLDEKTKLASKFKIDKIRTSVGYPNWYERPSKKKQYKGINMIPHNAEAKYCADKNKMFITAVYFQPPLYDTLLPFQMNYGSLGSLIGHEIYHSLDSTGLLFDVEGKKIAWWPHNMISSYNVKKECFIRQYSHYKIKEFQGYNDAPTKHSSTTVEEDVSDTMGLKAAYETYKLRLLEKNYVCDSLPQLSSYTCDQMFFISFARSFCFAATPREMMFSARYDEHHTPRIRVNGVLSNVKEFSDAFQCATNTPLNPKHKCDLWE